MLLNYLVLFTTNVSLRLTDVQVRLVYIICLIFLSNSQTYSMKTQRINFENTYFVIRSFNLLNTILYILKWNVYKKIATFFINI